MRPFRHIERSRNISKNVYSRENSGQEKVFDCFAKTCAVRTPVRTTLAFCKNIPILPNLHVGLLASRIATEACGL